MTSSPGKIYDKVKIWGSNGAHKSMNRRGGGERKHRTELTGPSCISAPHVRSVVGLDPPPPGGGGGGVSDVGAPSRRIGVAKKTPPLASLSSPPYLELLPEELLFFSSSPKSSSRRWYLDATASCRRRFTESGVSGTGVPNMPPPSP
jgi:hypothetical protein